MEKSTKIWLVAGGALVATLAIFGIYEEKKAKAASNPLADAARAAVSAMNASSNYCADVANAGTDVNATVHAFKSLWNATNPSNPVPINTGNYEPSVSAAIASLLGSAPAGCA